MEHRKLSTLKKLEGNPRTIKEADFKRLVDSIKGLPDYFEARPLILSNRTGEFVIIAGNQRYEAAKTLGMAEVPTFLLENLTEEREREIAIRDNINNGEWDWDKLAADWNTEQIGEWGVSKERFDNGYDDEFELTEGERADENGMTFAVSKEQKEIILKALASVETIDETYGNEDYNGNKLYQIAKEHTQWKTKKTSKN